MSDQEYQAKALTMIGLLIITASTLLCAGLARPVGPSHSIPGWLNPPAEPAR